MSPDLEPQGRPTVGAVLDVVASIRRCMSADEDLMKHLGRVAVACLTDEQLADLGAAIQDEQDARYREAFDGAELGRA